MADGNMGDLSFSLTLKSRIEEETKKITKELNKIDATGKQAQNALEAISEATKGIGDKGGQGLKKLTTLLKNYIVTLVCIQAKISLVQKNFNSWNLFRTGCTK